MLQQIAIAGQSLAPGQRCFIIAEAGSNFNNEYDLALRLIDIAADAQADAVKFQTFTGKDLYMPGTPITSNLVGKVTNNDAYELLNDLAMPREWLPKLADYAQSRGLLFMSTPFDFEAVQILDPLVPAFKIAASDLVFYPLLKAVGKTGKPVILSTGMANLELVERAVDAVRSTGNERIVLLHTVSNYPTNPKDLNLRAMTTLGSAFQLPYGLSDHTVKNFHSFAAIGMGACVIEKHYTFDNNAIGPDHAFALSPTALAELVEGIRSIELALGDGQKRMMPSETENREKAIRSLFFARSMQPGEIILESDLIINRPGTGLHPKYYEIVVGMKVREPVRRHAPVSWEVL
jgi:sialic acid synthase SpsE